jgi:hypothetical protein
VPFRIRGSSMPRKYDTTLLGMQILLIFLSVVSLFAYFVALQIDPLLTYIFMVLGFGSIASAGVMIFFAYKTTPEQDPNKPIITPQTIKLATALKERGIINELEAFDGDKHVAIAIPEATLYLEIDEKNHLTDPEHLLRDLQRDACSHDEGIDTIRIPDLYVDSYLDEVADAIAEVAKKRNTLEIIVPNHEDEIQDSVMKQ